MPVSKVNMEIEYSRKRTIFFVTVESNSKYTATHYRSSTCTVRSRQSLMLCLFDHRNVRNHFRSIRELNFMSLAGQECSKIFPTIRGWELVYKWLPKFGCSLLLPILVLEQTVIPNTAIKGWYIIGLQGHHDKEQLIIFKFLKENIRLFL